MMKAFSNRVKTWNDSEKYIKEIIHPLLIKYMKYSTISLFGAETISEAKYLTEQGKDIECFNGLAGMFGTLSILADNIYSTVLIKNKKSEVKELNIIVKQLNQITVFLDNNKDRLFYEDVTGKRLIKRYFWKYRKRANDYFIKLTELMTKNNLLFSGDFDEVKQEDLIKEIEEIALE